VLALDESWCSNCGLGSSCLVMIDVLHDGSTNRFHLNQLGSGRGVSFYMRCWCEIGEEEHDETN